MSAPVDVPAMAAWRCHAERVVSATRGFMRLARAFEANGPHYAENAAGCREIAASRLAWLRSRKPVYMRLARMQCAALARCTDADFEARR